MIRPRSAYLGTDLPPSAPAPPSDMDGDVAGPMGAARLEPAMDDAGVPPPADGAGDELAAAGDLIRQRAKEYLGFDADMIGTMPPQEILDQLREGYPDDRELLHALDLVGIGASGEEATEGGVSAEGTMSPMKFRPDQPY